MKNLKLNENSYLFNDRPSSELIVATNKYGDKENCELSLWVNGGSAYRFETNSEIANKVDALDFRTKEKLAERIALKVAETIRLEIEAEVLAIKNK